MMGETEAERNKGDMILNNYKRQIAERMAREKVDSYDAAAATKHPSNGKSISKCESLSSSKSASTAPRGLSKMNIKENTLHT